MNDFTSTQAPKGFAVTTSRDGYPAISYRTTGMWGLAVFLTVWLSGWTAACAFLAYTTFWAEPQINYGMLLFMIPFWGAEFLVLGFALWHFCSVTVFTFYSERLEIERVLFQYRRQRAIPKQEISAVRQVKDGGEGDDSFPSWGLAIDGTKNIKLLSRQEIEKSTWLGPIIAQWAGVEFAPVHEKKYEEI